MNLWGKHLIGTWIRYPTVSDCHGHLSYSFRCKAMRQAVAHCKLVLLRIAKIYQHAIYPHLRMYFLDHHNIARKSQQGREFAAAQHRVQWMLASVASSTSLNLVETNSAASHPSASNLTSKLVIINFPRVAILLFLVMDQILKVKN